MEDRGEKKWNRARAPRDWRLEIFRASLVVFVFFIVLRLFFLQVVEHGFYADLASGQHELFQELYPTRGRVFFQDLKDQNQVLAAGNQQLYFIYADPRRVADPTGAAAALGQIFAYDDAQIKALEQKFKKFQDPFEPIEHRVTDVVAAAITEAKLSGIHAVREVTRYYPEASLGGHVLGFLGSNEDGSVAGKYGTEGYFEKELAGTRGFLRAERDIMGRLIAVADRAQEKAVDGSDIVLTIDRTIQYTACAKLKEAVAKHAAKGGSVVILEPKTGKILALCGAPDFDPGAYGAAPSMFAYNNPAIFDDYEPGSIFKPLTLAAALDQEAVTPATLYEDTGQVVIDDRTIKNSNERAFGWQSMTQVLEKSLNTGAIFAMRSIGPELFAQYVRNFGLGAPTGVELDTEVAGDISSLAANRELYAATASFGQGLTATVLQMAAAFGAIANDGILKKIHVVDEIRAPDGTVQKFEPTDVRRVVSSKAARLLGAMLISVVENNRKNYAGVPGHYLAGKTGTAQVAKKDGAGYEEGVTIASYAGFGPVEDPRFVIVVRLDHPREQWADVTAAPLFRSLAAFLLEYFEIPPTRK